MTGTVVFIAVALAWISVSGRLSRRSVTAPIVFSVAGLVAALSPLAVGVRIDDEAIRLLVEITLAVVLFTDASSVAVRWLRTEWRVPARLLGIGLPLTIAAGLGAAVLLLPSDDGWLLAVVAAALAPTDAALGVSIVEDERIPSDFRQVINVESGLNDGLATPVVTFCVAMAAATLTHAGGHPVTAAVTELVLGTAVGAVVGVASARLLTIASDRGWAHTELLPIAPLLVAVGTYLLVVALGGNGFVAAFVAGIAFGAATREDEHASRLVYARRSGQLLGFAVWFLFGAGVLARHLDLVTWPVVLYAVLSLTVLRMLPVAVALVGTRLPWDTVLLTGWLGPRGLASIVFGILAADTVQGDAGQSVLGVVAVTVALSVVLHGLSAGPLAGWYSRRHPADRAA